jgi:hypothetical protein
MTRLGFHRDWYPLIVGVLIVVGFEFALIMWTTQGNFTYTLDDPYIHLALAENLARFGHYGLNVEEYSSPSSSILWPFLLVPFLAIGLGASGPLILNVLFAVAGVLVIHQIIVDSAKISRPVADVSWVWALLIYFVVNGFGVVFTGMEHALHMLVTAAIICLINRMQTDAGNGEGARSGYADLLLVLCIVLSPLIRFEGLAISAFAILMLGASGKSRLAIVSVLLTALCLTLYFHAMNVLGLPLLPSSVLVKSSAAADVASQGDLLGKLYGVSLNAMDRAVENFMGGEGRLLLFIAAFIAVQAIRMRRAGEKVSSIYVMGVLAVIALHFAFGRFGWYGRYQCYVFIFAIGAALHLFSGSLLRRELSRPLRLSYALLAIVAMATLGFQQTFYPLMTTPIAAQNIYEQQRQMHEFVAHHWKAPVAVNDIGYVAFQNDGYVLDLWGLGSEEARRLRQSGDSDMLHKLTVRHGVHLAMIYEHAFPDAIPADWRKVAELRLSTRRITPASDRVSFFVFGVDHAGCLRVADQLAEFKRTLAHSEALTVDREACSRVHISKVRTTLATNP